MKDIYHPYVPVLTGDSAQDFLTKEESVRNCTICRDREEYFRIKYNYDKIMAKSKLMLISDEEIKERRVKAYKKLII